MFFTLKKACARLTRAASAEAMARAGVPGAQAQALVFLNSMETRRISDLAAGLNLEKPAATALVGRLERAGFVSRAPDPRDARASILSLTPTGTRIAHEVLEMIGELDARLLDAFSEKERAIIAAFLNSVSRLDPGERGASYAD